MISFGTAWLFASLLPCGEQKGRIRRVNNWEAIADNLSKAGFSWVCSSEIDWTGRVIFTADAYSRDGRRFTVLADERLTAFAQTTRGDSSTI
jgi:hypothetical protein